MLKILQARLQQYMNHELPGVQAGFRTGRGFSVINEAEVDFSFFFSFFFLQFPCFLYDPANVGNLISGSSAFSKPNF